MLLYGQEILLENLLIVPVRGQTLPWDPGEFAASWCCMVPPGACADPLLSECLGIGLLPFLHLKVPPSDDAL